MVKERKRREAMELKSCNLKDEDVKEKNTTRDTKALNTGI